MATTILFVVVVGCAADGGVVATAEVAPRPPARTGFADLIKGVVALVSNAGNDLGDEVCLYHDRGVCNAHSTCTWCVAWAVPSDCYITAQAVSLPSGVFDCDKIKRGASGEVETEDLIRMP
ncbi:hypothetical protein CBR_g6678 [Chara braunii]|uniref:Secreted protein n=1 Tax=Chara braunii TaxID=69332 RepID=A0A388KKH2_CHABU|nr:hypothetical protein CBR_g6678 [Chara braunii]|eukprot:GBG70552.1 hypothetical protein CBR_g6678 [Chara braunii]